MPSDTGTMRRKYKIILQLAAIALLVFIIVFVWSSRLRKQKVNENMFEIALYDDDYDDGERLKSMFAKDMDRHAALRHIGMIGMPVKTTVRIAYPTSILHNLI